MLLVYWMFKFGLKCLGLMCAMVVLMCSWSLVILVLLLMGVRIRMVVYVFVLFL